MAKKNHTSSLVSPRRTKRGSDAANADASHQLNVLVQLPNIQARADQPAIDPVPQASHLDRVRSPDATTIDLSEHDARPTEPHSDSANSASTESPPTQARIDQPHNPQNRSSSALDANEPSETSQSSSDPQPGSSDSLVTRIEPGESLVGPSSTTSEAISDLDPEEKMTPLTGMAAATVMAAATSSMASVLATADPIPNSPSHLERAKQAGLKYAKQALGGHVDGCLPSEASADVDSETASVSPKTSIPGFARLKKMAFRLGSIALASTVSIYAVKALTFKSPLPADKTMWSVDAELPELPTPELAALVKVPAGPPVPASDSSDSSDSSEDDRGLLRLPAVNGPERIAQIPSSGIARSDGSRNHADSMARLPTGDAVRNQRLPSIGSTSGSTQPFGMPSSRSDVRLSGTIENFSQVDE